MKKMISALLISTLTAALLLAGCGKTGSEASTEPETAEGTKEAGGTFVVGFDQDFPPMGFVGDDGEFTGFDLELAQEVCNRLGLEYVPKPIAWDAKDAILNSGEIDCIWNGFTINGREENYAWTSPYLNNSQVFVVRKEEGIAGEKDLSGKVINVQADSSAEQALNDNPELTGTFGDLVQVPDYNTGFMNLESGACDALAMDVVVARYQIETRNADFEVLSYEIAAEEYGVGFAKDNTELRDKVQKTMEEMAKDGKMAEISEKWFGKDITKIGK